MNRPAPAAWYWRKPEKGRNEEWLFMKRSSSKKECTARREKVLPRRWRNWILENYRGTPLEGLDAYQRQLKRFDIRVSGPGSDLVEKFFQTSDSTALFPEYVSRAVRQGMEQADLLPNLVATVTNIAGMDYRTLSSEPSDDDKSLKPVAEGAVLPQTTVTTKDHLVHLYKRGRMLVASYEALRFQKLDLLTVALGQIGAGIAAAQLEDAVDVLINGDGSKDGITFASSTPLSYADFLKLWGSLAPYQLNAIAAGTGGIQKLLQISEFKDAQAGLNFQGTGKLVTPLGAALVHVPGMEEGKIIALDKNCALEMVQAGDVLVDSDKLIDLLHGRSNVAFKAGILDLYQSDNRKSCLLLDRSYVPDAAGADRRSPRHLCRSRHQVHHRFFLHIQRFSRNSLA